ncbi:MAG: sigma-70 family RNA polymerase sigma factor [Planctomycetes bacterium]|nr:sigma-70 family RNA polymerase sigma factor [Planctomycetota bacterium]
MATATPSPNWTEAEEADLLARMRAGDDAAFDRFVATLGPRLWTVVRRILRDEDDAREALQDAFLSAFKALATFQSGARLSTWMHRIAVNAALMKWRSKSRRSAHETTVDDLLPAFTETGCHAEPIPTWADRPDGASIRAEMGVLVREQIQKLPENVRIVLVLRDIEGLSYEDIAQRLEVTPNAAKIRVHRARQALKTLLEPKLSQIQS